MNCGQRLGVPDRVAISASDSFLCAKRSQDDISNESGVSVEDGGEERQKRNSTSDVSRVSSELCADADAALPEGILESAQEAAIGRLQAQLLSAHEELREKEQKCERLTLMQANVDKEIHELTASLFQEAYRMVTEANEKRAHAEKLLREANGKIDVLSAEVEALKILVVNSVATPDALKKRPLSLPASTSKAQSSCKRNARSGYNLLTWLLK